MHKLDKEDVLGISGAFIGEKLKLVIRTQYPFFAARLQTDGCEISDVGNLFEPFDRTTHVFFADKKAIGKKTRFVCREPDETEDAYFDFDGDISLANTAELISEYDSGITVLDETETEVCEGVKVKLLECADKDGRPVMAFALFADTKSAGFVTGTPNDGFVSSGCRSTVEAEALAAINNGKAVVAAVNADFFDMFGDFSPSGLCVKDGKVLSNKSSTRPFFGVLADGSPIIDSAENSPSGLFQAVGGRELLLENGEISDFAPLEPFGYLRHPRTAVGITADGNVIILVVDGRIPDYSNGATLVDTALFLKRLGAVRAVNLDGGGSSIMLVKRCESFEILNNPADLYRPTERLIREGYNSLLITKKN